MTVRECAEKTFTSTATIIRLGQKLGFDGFSDFKFYLKEANSSAAETFSYGENLTELNVFIRHLKKSSQKFDQAIKMVKKARMVIFLGVGTSGALAEYAARYFTNSGLEAYAINDPYQTLKSLGRKDVVTIVLSVSGETDKIIERLSFLRENQAQIIAITNHTHTTIGKLSDVNLTYEFQEVRSIYDPLENLTSQLPVLGYIEMLAQKASQNL